MEPAVKMLSGTHTQLALLGVGALEILLVVHMAGSQLRRSWRWLLIGFLAVTFASMTLWDSPADPADFWGGFFALLSVYFAWCYLRDVYAGKQAVWPLALSGGWAGIMAWLAPGLGLLMALAMMIFGGLHCLLHEREEHNLHFAQVGKRMVWRRWARSWGRFWLPAGVGAYLLLVGTTGAWGGVWPEGGRHVGSPVAWGYFSTFHQEFLAMLQPSADEAVVNKAFLHQVFRLPRAIYLFLVGMIPVLGLVASGYQLPGRFLYRLLRLEDEALLLWWLSALALILATFSRSTAGHLVSNGALAMLLGFLALDQWLRRKPGWDRLLISLAGVFWLLTAMAMGF